MIDKLGDIHLESIFDTIRCKVDKGGNENIKCDIVRYVQKFVDIEATTRVRKETPLGYLHEVSFDGKQMEGMTIGTGMIIEPKNEGQKVTCERRWIKTMPPLATMECTTTKRRTSSNFRRGDPRF